MRIKIVQLTSITHRKENFIFNRKKIIIFVNGNTNINGLWDKIISNTHTRHNLRYKGSISTLEYNVIEECKATWVDAIRESGVRGDSYSLAQCWVSVGPRPRQNWGQLLLKFSVAPDSLAAHHMDSPMCCPIICSLS